MGIKAEFWKPHITGWRDSGLSQAAYCRQHGLDLKRFGYWRRTLAPKAGDGSTPMMLPIVVTEATAVDERIEVRRPNGVQVRLSAGLEPARLVPMIRALWSC